MFDARPQPQFAPPTAEHAAPHASSSTDALEIDSARLLDGQREVLIRHGSECYRLRHTRNDKLILTK